MSNETYLAIADCLTAEFAEDGMFNEDVETQKKHLRGEFSESDINEYFL